LRGNPELVSEDELDDADCEYYISTLRSGVARNAPWAMAFTSTARQKTLLRLRPAANCR